MSNNKIRNEFEKWSKIPIYMQYSTDGFSWAAWQAASAVQAAEIARLAAELAQAQNGAQMYEYVRTLNPQQFGQLFDANISGNGRFDDLVQVAMLAAAPKPPGAA